MDLLGLILSPYRTLLSGAENQLSRFVSHSFGQSRNSHGVTGEEPQSSLPRLEDVGKVPGYEDITFEPMTIAPPTCLKTEVHSTRKNIERFAYVGEEDAREAIVRYARGQCCHHRDAVRHMRINEITMLSPFHYTLETFTERREVVWCYQPYDGKEVDLIKKRTPPGPWDIMQTPTEQFEDGEWQTEIPNTASVLRCRACFGTGKEKCPLCQGGTQVSCGLCKGLGRRTSCDSVCTRCDGNGRKRCMVCNNSGEIRCKTCFGKQKLKVYLKLITTWTNHKNKFVSQQTPLPTELLHGQTEQVAFQEEQFRVGPLDHFPQDNIKEASKILIREQMKAFPMERVLQQRHQIQIIPVAQVKYTRKRKTTGEFFVYGLENKVYFPGYRKSCCCSCVIA